MASKIVIPLKPDLAAYHEKWSRADTLVTGNEDMLSEYCFKLPNETIQSYNYRKKVFSRGFVNPTIELVNAPGNTIFGNEISIDIPNKNSRLNNFIENVTRSQSDPVPLDQYMRESVCPALRSHGTVFQLMDMPEINGAQSEAYQKENRIWPYVTTLPQKSVLNYEFLNGELLWFAYKVVHRDMWESPLDKQPMEEEQIRIWTRSEYVIKHANDKIDVFPNRFGFVPVIIQSGFRPHGQILGEAPFFTTSNLIITANNHLNTVNVELWKHATMLMLIHEESISGSNTNVDSGGNFSLKTTADGTALVWTGAEYAKPQYLIRDLDSVQPAIDMYKQYLSEAMDNEKSAKSVAKQGYDGSDAAQSGLALMVEREPILANIIGTALDCEAMHQKTVNMADAMINNGKQKENATVEYNMEYDLDTFEQMLTDTEKLLKTSIPSDTVIKEQYKRIATEVIKDRGTRTTAFKEIEDADLSEKVVSDEELSSLFDKKPDTKEAE